MVAPEHEAGKGLSVHDWLEVLEGAKPKAGGGYMARCPAHDDKNPSLSLDVGENGGAIVHCFAGCEYAEIKAAAGLERSAPPEPPSRATRTTRTTVFKIRDAVGRHVADHVRKEKPDASKDYSWRLPDGRWRLGGTKVEELPLYGSEQVESWNEGDLVVLAEGEKARDALGRAGFRALATVTGANGTPEPAALEVLRGRRVCLWADNDEAGRKHMDRIARALEGVALEVLDYEWSDAPEKGDAADHPAVKMGKPKALDWLQKDLEGAPRWSTKWPTDGSDGSDGFLGAVENIPPFPVEAMPVKTRALIREASKAIDCPVELVALPVLATLSAALGRAREVEVKRGHTQSASIYSVAIAESGAGKSPAAKVAWKPLKKIQIENGKEHKTAVEQYEDELRAHALKVKLARKNDEVEPRPPAKPVFERTWVDNATVEALASLLDGNPYGLGLFQDELSGWMSSFDQYKSGGKGDTRQQYIRIWGGDTISVDRKGDPEPLIVQDPFVTVSGSIQPRLVERIGGDREDGFINRFLMVYPNPHFSMENDHEISLEAEQAYERLVGDLYNLRPVPDSEDPPARVTFGARARARYKGYANELASRAGNPGNPQTLRETYPKLRAYLARLCLIVETCRELEAGGGLQVSTQDVDAAWKLVSYFEAVAKKVFHELASSDTSAKNAFEFSLLLKRQGGSMTATADEFRCALPSAPDTPEGTSKLLRKIARTTPQITVEDGYRGKERALKISLLEKTVGTVGTVGGDDDEIVDGEV